MNKGYSVPDSETCKHGYLIGHCSQCRIEQLQAENVLLRTLLDVIISDAVQGVEFASAGEILHACLNTPQTAKDATPQTAKVQAVLDAFKNQEQKFCEYISYSQI